MNRAEVQRRDDHLSLSGLNGFDGSSQSLPLVERSAPGDVKLLDRLNELQPVALAGCGDTIPLLTGGGERVSLAASHLTDSDDADGASPHERKLLQSTPACGTIGRVT